jgi:beta-phosphoglucomutase
MHYEKELQFITEKIKEAYGRFAVSGPQDIRSKSAFDLVTEVDVNIEKYLTDAILATFPGDKIHAEEMSSTQEITGRAWVIDPIDGTNNFAHDIPTFGIQCCLFDGGEPRMAVIWLPCQDELYTAIEGQGCWLNGKKVTVDKAVTADTAVISVGDFTHKSDRLAALQYKAVGYLYPRVAKLRMYGAASVDYAWFVSGRLAATIFTTRNLWDIAPGILLSQEAGAIIMGLDGKPYDYSKEGVMLAANEEIATLMQDAFNPAIPMHMGDRRNLKAFIFDFDGVVVDTEKYHYLSWCQSAAHVGYDLSWEEYLPLKSTGNTEITQYLCDHSGKDVSEELFQIMRQTKLTSFDELVKDLSEKDVLPGIRDFLTWLNEQGVRTAVASSSNTSSGLANRFDLTKHFGVVIDGNRKLPRKPAPDTFLLAAKMLGVEPKDCIVFEDSLAGIQAAVNAGMPVVAVGGIRSDKAVLHIQDFQGIREYFG